MITQHIFREIDIWRSSIVRKLQSTFRFELYICSNATKIQLSVNCELAESQNSNSHCSTIPIVWCSNQRSSYSIIIAAPFQDYGVQMNAEVCIESLKLTPEVLLFKSTQQLYQSHCNSSSILQCPNQRGCYSRIILAPFQVYSIQINAIVVMESSQLHSEVIVLKLMAVQGLKKFSQKTFKKPKGPDFKEYKRSTEFEVSQNPCFVRCDLTLPTNY